MVKIEVVEINHLDGEGNLKAFVTLRIGATKFYDFRIVQQPGQKAWVSPPVRVWETEDGQRKFRPLIEFPKDLKSQIDENVLAEYAKTSQKSEDDAPF